MVKRLHSFMTVAINFYNRWLNKVEQKWENVHPTSFKRYSILKNGSHMIVVDLMKYKVLWQKFNTDNTLSGFKREELMLFRKFPYVMLKSFPILISLTVPGFGFLLPLFLVKPTTFLTSYFWSENERHDFLQANIRKQTDMYPIVQKGLKKKTLKLKMSAEDMNRVVFLTYNTEMENLNEISKTIPLFEERLVLYRFSLPHLRHLKSFYRLPLHPFYTTHKQLKLYSAYIGYEDLHLVSENLDSVPYSELQELCTERVLNPFDLPKENLIEFLKLWSKFSTQAKIDNHSYRIHLALFISRCYQLNLNSKL